MNNKKKLRKLNGIMFIMVSFIVFVVAILSFFYDIPYVPRRIFLRIPAFIVCTFVYILFLLFLVPKVLK